MWMKVEKSSMIMKQMWKIWRITVIRKEIREAELNGEGEDERMSSTLSEKTMYYALRLDNGNVLRVSSTQKSAFALVWQLVPPLLGVLFLILVLFCGICLQTFRQGGGTSQQPGSGTSGGDQCV